MIVSVVLALVSSLPLALHAWRRRAVAPSLTTLAAIPALYLTLCVLGFALRIAHIYTPLFRRSNDDGGVMSLLALLVHGGGATLPVIGIGAAWWCVRAGERRRGAGLGALSLVAGALGAWALVIEPATLVERHYALRSARAPLGDITILHVSDLQTDGPCRREALAVEAAQRTLPDLVIFTGDLTNGLGPRDDPERRVAAANAFLRGLRARYAVLAVYGDWDAWGPDWPAWERRMLAGTQVVMLYNRAVTLETPGGRVVVYGSGGGGPASVTVVPDLRAETGYRIIAAHHPDALADGLLEGGADLALAGHTHGGQVVLPWVGALVTHSARGFVGGAYTVRGVPVVVSRGIGMRGDPSPRVRFRCPPEIAWLRVSR